MFVNEIDNYALIWFVFCWIGYSLFIHKNRKDNDNIYGAMHDHRLNWMKNSLLRDDRAVDAVTLGNLMRSVSFFASTSILILAALIPLLAYGVNIEAILSKLPFASVYPQTMVEIKILLLILIFTYAFFKYTWALRQYNYASIMILTTPHVKKISKTSEAIAERNANILSNAARHFSLGVRSYYFGLSILTWFLNPHLFIATTSLVVFVSYRREFMSRALNILGSLKS